MCVGSGGDEKALEFAGEPWEHYIVKDRDNGYKCLKCSKVGYNIREQSCKIPKPGDEVVLPATSSPASSTSHAGASAAVVGRAACAAGLPPDRRASLASSADLDVDDVDVESEMAALVLEVELQEKMLAKVHQAKADEQIALIESAEVSNEMEDEELAMQMELEELEMQLLQLDLSEAEALELAMKESLEEAKARESEGGGEDAKPADPTDAPVSERPALHRGEPLPETSPEDKKPKNKSRGKTDELPEVSAEDKKKYKNYWSRYVATPQNAPVTSPLSALPSSSTGGQAAMTCHAFASRHR